MKTILIQIQASLDNTIFDIYTDSDSYTTPIHYNITKNELESGYTSNIVPDSATTIKIVSNSIICPDQFILLPITTTTATTTTTITNEDIVSIYPYYNGTWGITAYKTNRPDAYTIVRETANATTIYDDILYTSGQINTSVSYPSPSTVLINISRYYMIVNVSDIIGNGITSSNISSISFKVYINSINGQINPITLDLFEAGVTLPTGNKARFRAYIQNSSLINNPNIKISSVVINDSGYYTFTINSYGLLVINQRILNNENIVLAIVTRYDSDNINPNSIYPEITISFKSILEQNVSKYPRLDFSIV